MSLEEKLITLPAHLLRRCHQISVATFLDICEEFEITAVQYAILTALKNYPGIDQINLAGLVSIDRSTMGNVLQRLENKKLVRKNFSPKDRRIRMVYITTKGSDLTDEMHPFVVKVQEEILNPLQDDEKEIFMSLLLKIAQGNNTLSRAPMKPPKSYKLP